MKKLGYMLYLGLLTLVLLSVFYHWLQVGSVGVLGSKYPPGIPKVISHLTLGSMDVVLTRNIFGEVGLGGGASKVVLDQVFDQKSNAKLSTRLLLLAIATNARGVLSAVIRAEIPGEGMLVRSYVGGEVLADGSKVVRVEKGFVELSLGDVSRQMTLFNYAGYGGE